MGKSYFLVLSCVFHFKHILLLYVREGKTSYVLLGRARRGSGRVVWRQKILRGN